MYFDICEDPDINFSGNDRVILTSLFLLLISFCLNYYCENSFVTFLSISLPLWLSLIYFCFYPNNNFIPFQEDMREKWGNLLLSNGTKFIREEDISLDRFINLYVDSYQRDDKLREYEYKCYKKNREIFGLQISERDMGNFGNEHFVLENNQLVSIKVSDWIVRCVDREDIYVIQDNTLKRTYKRV
jgi:hypothetical protein